MSLYLTVIGVTAPLKLPFSKQVLPFIKTAFICVIIQLHLEKGDTIVDFMPSIHKP